jgi:hypothetical protein
MAPKHHRAAPATTATPGLDRTDCRGDGSTEATEEKRLAVTTFLACVQVLASNPVVSGQKPADKHRDFSTYSSLKPKVTSEK